VPAERLDDGRVRISAPLTDDDVRELHAGDVVLVSGVVVGARDAAHKRMAEDLEAGRGLPFDPAGAILYYVGPTPERPGNVIGSAGPTTASRMDRWTPMLLERGLKAIVGKGGRGKEVRDALQRHTVVCLAALGGGGALAARRVTAQRVIAYDDLATEAIRELTLDDLPAWVIADAHGRDYYAEAREPWRRESSST
jgi:fumarate hydratase subunit beta